MFKARKHLPDVCLSSGCLTGMGGCHACAREREQKACLRVRDSP